MSIRQQVYNRAIIAAIAVAFAAMGVACDDNITRPPPRCPLPPVSPASKTKPKPELSKTQEVSLSNGTPESPESHKTKPNIPEKQPDVATSQSVDPAIRLNEATAACFSRLKATKRYRNAAAKEASALRRLKKLRESETKDGLPEASTAYLAAQSAVKKMEKSALMADADIKAAKSELSEFRKKREEQIRIRLQQEETRRQREEAQAAADPIETAIRERRLIRGMNYEQATRAIGKPYSITDGGNMLIVTWEAGSGNFWSATFVDDEAIIISHTRL